MTTRYGTSVTEWRPIPSCPGYFASQEGLIKGPRKVTKGSLGKNGYYAFRPGKGKVNVLVHRAVAEAWLEKTGPVVNHINHIKTDNRVSNLEWCTAQHNVRCSNIVHGHNKAKLNSALKELICADYVMTMASQSLLASKYGVTQRTIWNVLREFGIPAVDKRKLLPFHKDMIVQEYQRGNVSQRQLANTFAITQRTIHNTLRSAQ